MTPSTVTRAQMTANGRLSNMHNLIPSLHCCSFSSVVFVDVYTTWLICVCVCAVDDDSQSVDASRYHPRQRVDHARSEPLMKRHCHHSRNRHQASNQHCEERRRNGDLLRKDVTI